MDRLVVGKRDQVRALAGFGPTPVSEIVSEEPIDRKSLILRHPVSRTDVPKPPVPDLPEM
jgi:hypothetical protein